MKATDTAFDKIKTILDEEKEDFILRAFVVGGGCSGFQYGFTFDKEAKEEDFTLQKDGVTIAIDPLSYQYLSESEIDFEDNKLTSQFIIRNPNAKATCGCGSSFTI